jgi:serine/threonine protein kinase
MKDNKIPFYDLKSHGLIDDSEIKDSQGFFEEESFFEEPAPKTIDPKKQKAELEKDAEKKLSEYQLIRNIGQGAYAQVKLAQHKQTKQKVAIKIYPKFKLNDPSKRKAVQREILCM